MEVNLGPTIFRRIHYVNGPRTTILFCLSCAVVDKSSFDIPQVLCWRLFNLKREWRKTCWYSRQMWCARSDILTADAYQRVVLNLQERYFGLNPMLFIFDLPSQEVAHYSWILQLYK